MQSIVDLLETRAIESPDALLLAWEPVDAPAKEWTRGAFLHHVGSVAGGLVARGVKAGDRVLVHGDNSPELLLSFFACAWIGAVCVLANPKSSSDELAWFAERTSAVGAITQAGLPGRPATSANGLSWIAAIGDATDAPVFGDLNGPPPPRARTAPDHPACMLFTSGTTSRPKAVVWSHANLLWAAEAGRRGAGLLPSDIHLVCVPLYHVVGLAWSVLPALEAGAAIVLLPRFSASRFWPVALARRATVASHVQFSSAVLFRQPVPPGHAFRLWLNSTWLPEYQAHFGIPLIGWWGMTEIVAAGILGQPDRAQQAGTIGYAAPGYSLRIADSGQNELSPGQVGELELLGAPGRTIFSGYFGDAEATAAAFTDDGWFRTGDRVKVHADGSIQFVERARDVIKTGGEGVSPAEVERVIRLVPGVADVSVVGRPDPVLGETGVAFVVPQSAARGNGQLSTQIADFCKERLASFKVPREIRFIEQLPLVGINKVAKGELRRLAALSEPPAPTTHA
ncbi:MAG: AMP-binding protein [Gammaproteobacteria bacterium]|nr:AMP-binding protein [Gammaproteobacteria bacterium]